LALCDGAFADQDEDMATPEGMIELSENESWDLLRECVVRHGGVGRIAVSIMNHPDIFPVNYAVDDHSTDQNTGHNHDQNPAPSVIFRTAEGTKLAAAVLGVAVAFEIDGYDPEEGEAWSVVVKGEATEIDQTLGKFDPDSVPLFPWNAAPKHRLVRITAAEITGRRFSVVPSVRPA
jgi:uncharacterized protein